ncbi:DUF1772 domain-containing protein [Romeria aff. gracilis LEGE 07310]|uniref:DUF1772 domain-containing protein n=1 Tax=Vasconcelosia minhoensis LEGE 07310 TaxID=915328 RepID=A0A8J7APZ7_9CYAN|nr:DUF1772 domain-containing protein [Romeria gracilis]MBE9079080.1 DUF1772 domain-containing protein [Romeria aff. gracilis LEGE 07310]
MFNILQVLTVMLIAIAMALALAHALELPGKMRLDREAYYATQSIYYPGFTYGGACEPIGILSTTVLLVLMPSRSTNFWLTLVALLGLIGMQAVYWFFTHPINKFWVEGENLDRFSSDFFSFGTNKAQAESETCPPDWMELRDRWEYSHVARAGFAILSLVAIVIAIS